MALQWDIYENMRLKDVGKIGNCWQIVKCSPDTQFIAFGSAQGSIKIIDKRFSFVEEVELSDLFDCS